MCAQQWYVNGRQAPTRNKTEKKITSHDERGEGRKRREWVDSAKTNVRWESGVQGCKVLYLIGGQVAAVRGSEVGVLRTGATERTMKKGMTHSTAPAHCPPKPKTQQQQTRQKNKKTKKGARCVRKLTDAICFGLCASSSCKGFVGRGLGVCVCEQGVLRAQAAALASSSSKVVWQKFGLIVTAGSGSVGDSGPPNTKKAATSGFAGTTHLLCHIISFKTTHPKHNNHAIITRSSIAVQVSQSKQTTDWTSTSRS